MNIYVKLIVGALLFDMVLYGIKYQMYHRLLWACKYTRIIRVLKYERILYHIRHIGLKIPFLIIRPSQNKVENLQEEYRYATWKMEKLLIGFEIVINLLRYIIGIRPIYIICIGYWSWCNFEEKIEAILLFIWDKVTKVDYIGGVQTIYDYVVANVSGLLILVLILVVIYNYNLKTKVSKYNFEQIWANDSEKKVREVALAQKNIEAEIKKLYGDIWNNMKELKKMIDKLDRYYLYSEKEQFKPETCRLVEYYDRVEKIKSEIKRIEECEGRKLYIDYNKKIWRQLMILSLTDSNNKYFYAEDISDCDKKSIENSTDSIGKNNYKSVRKLWMMYWTTGISCLNGIERYLQYILVRKVRFENIYYKIKSTTNLKKILEDIKELKEE